MPVDVDSAEQFVLANARLLARHRLAVLRHRAPPAPVLDALRAYRNPDGGFGHALEPDVRAPESEPAAMLHALDVLAGIGALDDPMVGDAVAWVATIADPDGGVPFVLPTAANHPHAPWMVPTGGGSHLTFAIAGALWKAGSSEPWLQRATEWCWARLAHPGRCPRTPGSAAVHCSPTTRSRPTSTCWSGGSKLTAAGPSTGSRGRQGSPRNGGAS